MAPFANACWRASPRRANSAARLLDEYHVGLVVIDRNLQPYLIQQLQVNRKWKIVYEDPRARIYARK